VRPFHILETAPCTDPSLRHIDSAQAYRNEPAVGAAVRDSTIPRSDVFISTLPSLPHHLYFIVCSDQGRHQIARV
jgi:hypothetical protein